MWRRLKRNVEERREGDKDVKGTKERKKEGEGLWQQEIVPR
jgi:hypothetical protein